MGKCSLRFGDERVECFSDKGECKRRMMENEERVFWGCWNAMIIQIAEGKLDCSSELGDLIVFVNIISGFLCLWFYFFPIGCQEFACE